MYILIVSLTFGKFANENCKKKGKRKPETFDFLGFTHYCSKGRFGNFRVKRKTAKKKLNQKAQEYKNWIKKNRNKSIKEIMTITRSKLIGHYNYYGITDNIDSLRRYRNIITQTLFKWLNRRSQRKSYTSEQFNIMLRKYNLPMPKIKADIYAI